MSRSYWRKRILTPELSTDLAEFIGIMIGDGCITKYQIAITLNLVTDLEYAFYVDELITGLFGIVVTHQIRRSSNCIVLVVSSIKLVDFLVSLGLARGNKLRQPIDIPEWVIENEDYLRACIRGIFDTDGSIFQETHFYKQRTYSYTRLALVSYSRLLRLSVCRSLCNMGISAKERSGRNVSIERFTDIREYFRIIGSRNPKHLARYCALGGVG